MGVERHHLGSKERVSSDLDVIGFPSAAGRGIRHRLRAGGTLRALQGSAARGRAGNDSDRSLQRFCPVSSPAGLPSILAVGAVDEELNVANFSNRAVNPSGLVDFVAPGVGIHSAWVMPTRYRTLSGTSMATLTWPASSHSCGRSTLLPHPRRSRRY